MGFWRRDREARDGFRHSPDQLGGRDEDGEIIPFAFDALLPQRGYGMRDRCYLFTVQMARRLAQRASHLLVQFERWRGRRARSVVLPFRGSPVWPNVTFMMCS